MTLGRDGRLIFTTRAVRMFGYGLASVVLVLYLAALGLPDPAIGAAADATLLGDAAISLWLTTHADRVGRRRVLLVGSAADVRWPGIGLRLDAAPSRC